MSQATAQLFGTLAAALLALVGIWLTVRQAGKQTKTNVAQQLIDQLQEERTTIQDRLDRMERESRAEVAELRTKVDRMARENLLLRDFVQELRQDIRTGTPPPPRPWPPELADGR